MILADLYDGGSALSNIHVIYLVPPRGPQEENRDREYPIPLYL